ncbi:hypothetical protein NMG60_11008062 [Bertholletia excelsa]
MASTSLSLLQIFSLRREHNAPVTACKADSPKSAPVSSTAALPGRRQWLVLLTATTALKATEMSARAEDIPLFGLRKKLKKAEEEAEVVVKEGFEAAEKGVEAAEVGIQAAEKGIETAERQIESAVSFGGLAQAGVVAGAEFVGVLVATSVVNGILGPEAQKS